MKQLIKRLFSGTCLWFTLLAVGLMLIRLIAEGSGDGIIEIPRFLLLLPCGLFLAAAGTIYRHTALAGWARLLLHYLFCMLAFFLFLWLPAGGRTAVKNLLHADLRRSLCGCPADAQTRSRHSGGGLTRHRWRYEKTLCNCPFARAFCPAFSAPAPRGIG